MSDHIQRERSRSPRRRSSRSPPRRTRRSYSPRSRSRSRGERDEYRRPERRSRSPLSTSGAAVGPPGSASPFGGRSGYPPARFEDRTVAKENMMQTVRDSSQQDRRVYVGNLSYDVKWHHLKDFMRQGEQGCAFGMVICWNVLKLTRVVISCFTAGEVLFADVLLLPNGMSKVGAYM